MSTLTLLGFAPEATLAAQAAAMRAVDGPKLVVVAGEGVAAVAQAGAPPCRATRTPGRSRLSAARLKSLATVQARLEQACLNGAFLPADQGRAAVASGLLPGLLAVEAPRLAHAIALHGSLRQWDVILRWPPQAVLTPARQALETARADRAVLAAAVADVLAKARAVRDEALHGALAAAAYALLPLAPGDCAAGYTVLAGRDGDQAIIAALDGLPAAVTAGAEADLRGPMPPVSFAVARLETNTASGIAAAWQRLELPALLDDAGLRAAWRRGAFAAHPDQGGAGAGADALHEAAGAYRLLRRVLHPGSRLTLAEAQARAGVTLHLPPALEDAA
jgi:hypothetical protein